MLDRFDGAAESRALSACGRWYGIPRPESERIVWQAASRHIRFPYVTTCRCAAAMSPIATADSCGESCGVPLGFMQAGRNTQKRRVQLGFQIAIVLFHSTVRFLFGPIGNQIGAIGHSHTAEGGRRNRGLARAGGP